MKKLYLTIIAVFLSITGQCFGEWKYDASSETYKGYIDYSKIKTEGLYKSLWSLNDYISPQSNSLGKQYKSVVSKRVIDCQASRTQIVALFQYSEEMGNGVIVFSENYKIRESDWGYHPPDSFGDGFIKAACIKSQTPTVIAPVITKPIPNNPQDIKRQRCINLGLAPNSADFQQCMK